MADEQYHSNNVRYWIDLEDWQRAVAVRAVEALRAAIDSGHEYRCEAEMNQYASPQNQLTCDCRLVGMNAALVEVLASGWEP